MTTPDGRKLDPILRGTTDLASWRRTSIDRSKCIRTVPMRVLSLGYPRTGTMSTATALSILGFNDVYHMASVFENPRDCEMWRRAIRARMGREGRGGGEKEEFTKRDWDGLLGHCQAVTDWPCSAFAEELIAAYPDAKVILHVRPTDKWFASASSTVLSLGDMSSVPFLVRPFVRAIGWVTVRFGPLMSQFHPVQAGLWDMVTHGDLTPTGYRTAYESHNAHVLSLIPPSSNPNRILLWGPQDGWEPLCKFLGVPVPEVPLPYINETESFKASVKALFDKDLGDVVREGVRRGVLAGVVAVAVVGVWKAMGLTGLMRGYLPTSF